MEEIASFLLILTIYFLGILAIVQGFARPKYFFSRKGSKETIKIPVNYLRVLLLSLLLALITTTLAYIFLI